MRVSIRENSNGDRVILLVKNGEVRSVWNLDRTNINDVLDIRIGGPIEDWDDQFGTGIPEDEYGELVVSRSGSELTIPDWRAFGKLLTDWIAFRI